MVLVLVILAVFAGVCSCSDASPTAPVLTGEEHPGAVIAGVYIPPLDSGWVFDTTVQSTVTVMFRGDSASTPRTSNVFESLPCAFYFVKPDSFRSFILVRVFAFRNTVSARLPNAEGVGLHEYNDRDGLGLFELNISWTGDSGYTTVDSLHWYTN
jgi:hypothetical protein